ncbi:MAG: proline--tRNA ligase [Bacillota bacterium]|nr:proline--tRNA ligase [Bacillota bacterium]
MRMSQALIPTLREAPAEAEVASHQLMLRAGLIRKEAAGIYTLLPLGLRVIRKIETIVREEMDRQGAQELLLPIIQPAELWRQTGRWEVYGEEMFRLKDRHGREFCLGPTHEEIITALVKNEVRSYRQLPLLLYQIQNKYRDEIRPRFGLMRGREFIMKDLYSFDRDEEGLRQSYAKMYEAYTRVFTRCGLTFRAVEADPGQIGGTTTHEFMVLAPAGEAGVVFCERCPYAANVETAECLPPEPEAGPPPGPPERRETPGRKTVEEVAAFLQVPPARLIKTLLYETEQGPVAALVRGDHQLNELKLARTLRVGWVKLAGEETVQRISGAPPGFAGPVGLKGVRVVADRAVLALAWGVTGANAEDAHLVHVVPRRDFQPDWEADLRLAQAGDLCPRCRQGRLQESRGIEVGQIFQLGTKYSEALGATYTLEDGTERPIVMGCYGIGIGRTMAAAIEQHHDENGIIWPLSIAPFAVCIVTVNQREAEQAKVAEELYRRLWEMGIETIWDDRDERAGVKFKDADLLGFPLRVTVGPRALAQGEIEVKFRATGEVRTFPRQQAAEGIAELLRSWGGEPGVSGGSDTGL